MGLGVLQSIRLTNCTLKLKKDTRLQIVNPIPAKFGLVRRPTAALKGPLSGACERFARSFENHSSERTSGP